MAADTPEPQSNAARAEPAPAREPAHDRPDGHRTVRVPVAGPDGHPPGEAPPKSHRTRWVVLGVTAAALLVFGLTYGRVWILDYLNTEWTDDAFVNSHVSFLSPRVAGYTLQVYVDDNDRVSKGDLLVELDHEPYRVMVGQKKAALAVAEANLRAATAQVRAQEAAARSSWYSLVNAQEQVRYQVATIRANVANLRLQEANLELARKQIDRVRVLVSREAAAPEELDQRIADYQVARQRVRDAREEVGRVRAALGLPPDERDPTDVPANLEQNFSAVQTALSGAAQALAQIGLEIPLYQLTPRTLLRRLVSYDANGHQRYNPQAVASAAGLLAAPAGTGPLAATASEGARRGDLNQVLDAVIDRAPAVLQARAARDQAHEDLRNAQLNLDYTWLYAPIDGVISRRNVNPGTNVAVGQSLMAVRSLTEVWVDANFKETQLHNIVVGQPVEVRLDAYPKKVFRGRVEGFSPGTGGALSLLPPENATGNFVKVVQRLPVRITVDPADVTPDTPLLTGLSAVPSVLIKEQPTGPDAGKRLLAPVPSPRGGPGDVSPTGTNRTGGLTPPPGDSGGGGGDPRGQGRRPPGDAGTSAGPNAARGAAPGNAPPGGNAPAGGAGR